MIKPQLPYIQIIVALWENDSNAQIFQPPLCHLSGRIYLNHLEIAGFIIYNLVSWKSPNDRGIGWIERGA